VAVDQTSGIAIFGYDPVGYYVEKSATPGREDYEWLWHGAVWRFASQANREEFKRAPEAFAPSYGGYDADAVTRGVASFPDPTVFAIVDDRLFLFRSHEAMERFLASDGIDAADAAWPRLMEYLRP
jgi:YHS domain-containing protein